MRISARFRRLLDLPVALVMVAALVVSWWLRTGPAGPEGWARADQR
ncbi:hypothetical protein ACFFWC_31000 [Plantactinospora siamensis]|uniref:Uncharacterized protein n=1 Tax=Plantactinospora siamensis TaxID=555372 RepID=A0ABV6NSS6_9ACTN